MTTRALLYTPGSPFARAVRVVLDELGLEYEHREDTSAPPASEAATLTPTLQVPVLWDGDQRLWDSVLIVDYLLSNYEQVTEYPVPLADSLVRPGTPWNDRLVLSTIQTLGTAVTTISQMRWGGTRIEDSGYLARSAERIPHILAWLESGMRNDRVGFFPGKLSAQDIFLCCHLEFVENRPIGLDCDLSGLPRIGALLERMRTRPSFRDNPIHWWDPDVTGYEDDGTPLYDRVDAET